MAWLHRMVTNNNARRHTELTTIQSWRARRILSRSTMFCPLSLGHSSISTCGTCPTHHLIVRADLRQHNVCVGERSAASQEASTCQTGIYVAALRESAALFCVGVQLTCV